MEAPPKKCAKLLSVLKLDFFKILKALVATLAELESPGCCDATGLKPRIYIF